MAAVFSRRHFVRIAIATLLSALTLAMMPASAAWITIDDPKWGPDSVVQDTSTSLEWLNLRSTIGLAPAQVIAGLRPGGEFSGFRYATWQEFGSLTSRFFSIASVCCYRPLDAAMTAAFANLFGPTLTDTDLGTPRPGIDGYFDFPSDGRGDGVGSKFFYEVSDGQVDCVYDSNSFTVNFPALPHRGSYLVRSIDEPGVLSLVGAALLGLLAGVRRKRRIVSSWLAVPDGDRGRASGNGAGR